MKRFKTVLVANRGEIACRIIRTLNTLGLKSIAVFSAADNDAPHVEVADEAVCIGPPPVHQSYLDGEKIIEAALKSGAEAIHPGYGFLSENAHFAASVINSDLIFIGPSSQSISIMGNKAEAKRHMQSANVPCVPGYEGEDQSLPSFMVAAEEIGYPIMVKAAAGGGGRGMRQVDTKQELENALSVAANEAKNAFGSGELILEKAITRPRHVEIQVFADQHGNCIHLGERDCSVQRRHQKIIEESPCPVLSPELRERMGNAAVAAAKSVDYVGAGTVEFLLDEDQRFYFLEMNTRLQVEHPVTEMVTGHDLVALQIAVAQGEPLPMVQEDVQLSGHAIEVRLYAEDPSADFLPSTGKIKLWDSAPSEGVRIDAGIVSGIEVPPYYDPMLAKIITHGPTREVARTKLVQALENTILFGTKNNREFLIDALGKEPFVQGTATVNFIVENYEDGYQRNIVGKLDIAIAAALHTHLKLLKYFRNSPCRTPELLGWTSSSALAKPLGILSGAQKIDVFVTVKGNLFHVALPEDKATDDKASIAIEFDALSGNRARLFIDGRISEITFLEEPGDVLWIHRNGISHQFHVPSSSDNRDAAEVGNIIKAPMPGNIIDVKVEPGQAATAGDTVLIIEAMKMQHPVKVLKDATIKSVSVVPGSQVKSGDLLVELEDTE